MTSISVKSFGCSANLAEGEMIKGILKNSGYKINNDEDNGDVIIVNICTVKGDSHALKEVRKLREENPNKKLVIAGCITQSIKNKLHEISPEASLVSTHNITNIEEGVSSTLKNSPIEILSKSYQQKIKLPKIRKNPTVSIIPIANGCDSTCTFCSVKLVKGKLQSYKISDVLCEVERSVRDGCKEVWLTSQDNGCYGLDIETNLVKLLKATVNIEEDFMIRVGMANPKHVVKFYKELAEVYKHPKIFKFLHLPVQSGNNKILELMKREHTAEDYIEVIKHFKKEIPEITIATDIICGFPNETKEQFEDTIKLLEETKPDVVNISRFAPRQGTIAAKMENQIIGEEKKNRSKILTEVFEKIALEKNKKWQNWEGNIILEDAGKNNTFEGRNYAYKPIVVKGDCKLGDIVKIKVTDTKTHHLIGTIIKPEIIVEKNEELNEFKTIKANVHLPFVVRLHEGTLG